ncbi:MAG TPA: hypothetical protein VGI65_11365 [Steroidobacteraceae bacterium]
MPKNLVYNAFGGRGVSIPLRLARTAPSLRFMGRRSKSSKIATATIATVLTAHVPHVQPVEAEVTPPSARRPDMDDSHEEHEAAPLNAGQGQEQAPPAAALPPGRQLNDAGPQNYAALEQSILQASMDTTNRRNNALLDRPQADVTKATTDVLLGVDQTVAQSAAP